VPEANAVSPGELLFGIERTKETGRSFGSRPVLQEIRTVLGTLRRNPSGTRFGFGGNFVASRETLLGLLPTGFSNSILMSREGQVASIHGHIVPIIMVGLEHAVVDLTGIPEVYEGCPVTLVARDSAVKMSLDRIAELQRRSPLEILTSLPAHSAYEYIAANQIDRSLRVSNSSFSG
jgi:alanine racemase